MQHISASILTIGDELLIGQVIDTNSAWIGQQLNSIGVWVQRRVAVGDSYNAIWTAIDQEVAVSDIIIITGGLGPTADDITKPLLNEYFGGHLKTDPQALENVKNIFARYNRPLLEVNIKQAEVPDNCLIMQNARGTAPGMQFEKDGKLFFSMPGVPFEMQGMVTTYVLPAIIQKFQLSKVQHRSLTTMGIGESFLAERLQSFEKQLPATTKMAYLPGASLVRLRLTEQPGQASSQIQQQFEILRQLVSDILVTDEDEDIAVAISRLLIRNGKSVTTAESCTGGYIASLFTAIAGASAFFPGSIISYDNVVKANLLQVPELIIETHGAVSEEVVRLMATNVLKVMKTDYSVAVSGILGPDGGSPEKPVGTVWIAVANKNKIKTQKCQFQYDRLRNREATANNALNLLRQLIQEGD